MLSLSSYPHFCFGREGLRRGGGCRLLLEIFGFNWIVQGVHCIVTLMLLVHQYFSRIRICACRVAYWNECVWRFWLLTKKEIFQKYSPNVMILHQYMNYFRSSSSDFLGGVYTSPHPWDDMLLNDRFMVSGCML